MSLCKSCKGLEIWPGAFVSRYLCGYRLGDQMKAFGKYGRPCLKGTPIVKQCAKYQEGGHYSRRENDKQNTD